MGRVGVFIDAGYLFAAGSIAQVGTKVPRGQISFQVENGVHFFKELAEELTGLPLLRIYWYDGASAGPTRQQTDLAFTPNVKVRLGFVNQQGAQKGVDSLLVTDMINLARNRAMESAVLLAGDEDVRVGVQQAQDFGVRVHLVGIEPRRNNQSALLVQEADDVAELSAAQLAPFFQARSTVQISLPPGATEEQVADAVVEAIVDSMAPAEFQDVAERFSRGEVAIPRTLDGQLVSTCSKQLEHGPQTKMEEPLKFYLRKRIREVVLSRLPT